MQTEWRRESYQLWGRQDADSRGCEGLRLSGHKTKVTTASDVWMSIIIIIRTIFSVLNPVFLNAANVGIPCSVLNGESADVPEDIVVEWSLRYPRSATAIPRKPFSV